MRITLFLMLKEAMFSKDSPADIGNTAAIWQNTMQVPGVLSIKADQNTIEEAIKICTSYYPVEIIRQTDQSDKPIPIVRVTMRFDTMKPGIQKQISQRLLQQLQGRVSVNWYNDL
ncbi:MAG: hypothetical protein JWM28_2092 [Chitinophagaceae bacterium]|nr:hypothetical protein [Chitinophagaceae bacterium]